MTAVVTGLVALALDRLRVKIPRAVPTFSGAIGVLLSGAALAYHAGFGHGTDAPEEMSLLPLLKAHPAPVLFVVFGVMMALVSVRRAGA